MELYRFSPINDEEKLREVVSYIKNELDKLSKLIIGETLPISYLTVFAHYNAEYDSLVRIMSELGGVSDANNGIKVKLTESIDAVDLVRIRKPDPYRMQVGCGDFAVPSYTDFKESFLHQSESLRLIKRPEYEMIEFFDPDIDVLGYILSK